jgi:hypothetical protein
VRGQGNAKQIKRVEEEGANANTKVVTKTHFVTENDIVPNSNQNNAYFRNHNVR